MIGDEEEGVSAPSAVKRRRRARRRWRRGGGCDDDKRTRNEDGNSEGGDSSYISGARSASELSAHVEGRESGCGVPRRGEHDDDHYYNSVDTNGRWPPPIPSRADETPPQDVGGSALQKSVTRRQKVSVRPDPPSPPTTSPAKSVSPLLPSSVLPESGRGASSGSSTLTG